MPENTYPMQVARGMPSLRDRTTQVLRDAILDMHLPPGAPLIERRLCEETGVSRTSVREALRHLQAEGLVEGRGRSGLRVARVGPEEARQIYEVRRALESAAARCFVERAGTDQLDALTKAFGRVEATIFGPDIRAYVAALHGFSDALLAGAGNELARLLLNGLQARIAYLRTLTARAAGRDQKQRTLRALRWIVDALQQRDPEAAETGARAYVDQSAAFALKVLAQPAAGMSEVNEGSPRPLWL